MRMFLPIPFILLAALMLRPLPVAAQSAADQAGEGNVLEEVSPLPKPDLRAGYNPGDDWHVTVGGAGLYGPNYLGSDEYELEPLPLFDLRYRDRFFLSTRDGLGLNLSDHPRLRAGPVLKYRHKRDEDDDGDLDGLGDVDSAGEAGGYVHYDLRPFSLGAEIRQGFGGHEGLIGDFFAAWTTLLGDRLQLTAGPKMTVASSDFTESYFSIDGGQAARSGYSPYDADGLFWSYGFGAALTYRLSDGWAIGGYAGIDRIEGDAADSPIVDQAGSATQARIGFSLGYSFGWAR